MTQPLWQLLQVSDVLDVEFANALLESVPVLAWEPERSLFPAHIRPGHEEERTEGGLRLRKLPLLRGFARAPMSWLARTGPGVTARLLRQTEDPERTPLIITVPFFAPVAELWPGPVVYWLTDLIAEYTSADRAVVEGLDRRLVEAATLVCPNSRRLQDYLITHAECDPAKIHVIPNATRQMNLLPEPPAGPLPRPETLRAIPGLDGRPIAGIIGNLAANMDWCLLERTIELTPWLSWVFVGPTTMAMADPVQRRARQTVVEHPNAHFIGKQPYGDLASFARAFDVAILPYRRCEPTFSGSSTRFYEHLAACRPMLATRGLDELTLKPPLLKLIDTPEHAAESLNQLRLQNFDDGLLGLRWQASLEATWQVRAQDVQTALVPRLRRNLHRNSDLRASPVNRATPTRI